MEDERPQVVIFAEAPKALVALCGVSLLERQLRILQRLGFDRALIVSTTADQIRAAMDPPSWARRDLAADLVTPDELRLAPERRVLVLPGDHYLDARLIAALLRVGKSACLVDSDPPKRVRPLLSGRFDSGAALVLPNEIDSRSHADLAEVDAAAVPDYVRGMRRRIRPVFFPAPGPNDLRAAERIVFDTGQNGTLDIPAILHSPIETWILRWLCRTSVTPNEITLFGLLVAALATLLFASGHLASGLILAIASGVIDGLDGKQARVKIETTPAGKWEHRLDFVIETSWWAALAFWLQRSGALAEAWWFFALIMIGEVVDQLAKLIAQRRIDRLLDDYSPFDRFVRLIGARRDMYICSLAVGLLIGAAARAYEFCAWWGVITASVHTVRAMMITARRVR
jgi:phosphatidylglycerophosphate synthase